MQAAELPVGSREFVSKRGIVSSLSDEFLVIINGLLGQVASERLRVLSVREYLVIAHAGEIANGLMGQSEATFGGGALSLGHVTLVLSLSQAGSGKPPLPGHGRETG